MPRIYELIISINNNKCHEIHKIPIFFNKKHKRHKSASTKRHQRKDRGAKATKIKNKTTLH
jgi:hypothetical protein